MSTSPEGSCPSLSPPPTSLSRSSPPSGVPSRQNSQIDTHALYAGEAHVPAHTKSSKATGTSDSNSFVFDTLRNRLNGHYCADNILKCIFMNENRWNFIKISLKFVIVWQSQLNISNDALLMSSIIVPFS